MVKNICMLLGLLVLAGCGLNEKMCQDGDWTGIGRKDGESGRSASFLDNHVTSCAKFGITPDPVAWETGRQIGLKVYCTPQNAYEVGANGRGLKPVCTPDQLRDMSAAHTKGKSYYRVTSDIRDLEQERRALLFNLDAIKDPKVGSQQRALTLAKISQIDARISLLLVQRARYAEF